MKCKTCGLEYEESLCPYCHPKPMLEASEKLQNRNPVDIWTDIGYKSQRLLVVYGAAVMTLLNESGVDFSKCPKDKDGTVILDGDMLKPIVAGARRIAEIMEEVSEHLGTTK